MRLYKYKNNIEQTINNLYAKQNFLSSYYNNLNFQFPLNQNRNH